MTSLSLKADPDPTLKIAAPPLPVFPVENQPGLYMIDSILIGPDYVFSFGARLKGRPARRAKSYVLAESKRLKGALICELGEHYVTEQTGEIHHRVRRDHHVAKTLGLACHSHNAVHGAPRLVPPGPSEMIERENVGASIPPQASSLESAKHDPQRDAWNQLIAKGHVFEELKRLGCESLTLPDGEYVLAADLAEIAVSMTVDQVYGKYSSETFMRYEREDRFDTLQMVKERGRWWVKSR